MSNLGNQELGDIILGASGEEEESFLGAHGQAQASIKATSVKHGQAQAQIKQIYNVHGQCQAYIAARFFVHSQCQALIYRAEGYGQANASIKQTYPLCVGEESEGSGGAILGSLILGEAVLGSESSEEESQTCIGLFGQAQALITRSRYAHGQAQGYIPGETRVYGQCQAQIKQTYNQHGQCQAWIENTYRGHGQAQGEIDTEAPANVHLLDTFTRTRGFNTGLGTPDVGPTWTHPALADNDHVRVDGSHLELHVGDQEYNYVDAISTINTNDIDIFAEFIIETHSTRVYSFLDFAFDGFAVEAFMADENLWRVDTSTGNTTATFTTAANTWYRIRFQIEGGNARFKIWAVGESEPLEWLIERTGATTTPDNFELYADEGFNDPAKILIDNILIVDYSNGVVQHHHGQAQAFILAPIKHGQAAGAINSSIKQAWGQAQAEIFPQNVILKDTFSRIIYLTHRDRLGTPDGGWYRFFDSFDRGMISSDGKLVTLPYSGVTTKDAYLGALTDIGNFTASIDFTASDYNPSQALLEIFATSAGFSELLDFYYDSSTINLDTTSSNVNTAFTLVDGTSYRMMLYSDGTTAKAKIWDLSTAEPDWMLSIAHSATTFQRVEFAIELGTVADGTELSIDNVNIHSTDSAIGIGSGQARANIARFIAHGQARAQIKKTDNNRHGQTQGFIRKLAGRGQAQAIIVKTTFKHGQAQGTLTTPGLMSGQAQAAIFRPIAQAHAWIRNLWNQQAQAQAWIIQHWRKQAQAQGLIGVLQGNTGLAQAVIHRTQGYGQAQAFLPIRYGTGQSQADIEATNSLHGQALARIGNRALYGQGQAYIRRTNRGHGLATAYIIDTRGHGQAQGYIRLPYGNGQAQAFIGNKTMYTVLGQAHAIIKYNYILHGLALATISKTVRSGQAQAKILAFGQRAFGNTQARILAKTVTYAHGQAMAYIKGPMSGQAAALISGTKYLVRFNNYDLPGYAQQETIDSVARIERHLAPFQDGQLAEYIGLENKIVSIRMKTLGRDYLDVKNQVQKATTMVRSTNKYTKLYIQYTDRYFEAMGQKIVSDKSVGTGMRNLDYTVDFEAKPWLTSDRIYTISGTGTINTDSIGRTIYNGGWTPAKVTITGTNVTVSGYNSLGEFTGFISVSGAVTNLTIDSNLYTAKINNTNVNDLLHTPDYILFVGPGKTFFVITGASSATIEWQDRWYL